MRGIGLAPGRRARPKPGAPRRGGFTDRRSIEGGARAGLATESRLRGTSAPHGRRGHGTARRHSRDGPLNSSAWAFLLWPDDDMRIVVTGGTGVAGGWLAEACLGPGGVQWFGRGRRAVRPPEWADKASQMALRACDLCDRDAVE